MTTTPISYKDMTFDALIRAAQSGDEKAVEYLLIEAKYLDYTFNFHLRKAASKYFKYGTDDMFNGLINDLYIIITKNDFHAIKSFNRDNEQDPTILKRMFYGWLLITANRHFNELRKKYFSRPQCDVGKCVIPVAAEECSLTPTNSDAMLREAIATLKKEEQRIVLYQSLESGDARKSQNIAKVLTEWRRKRGDMRAATEAEVNCIKSRAYIELRPTLAAMYPDRVMRKPINKSRSTQCG